MDVVLTAGLIASAGTRYRMMQEGMAVWWQDCIRWRSQMMQRTRHERPAHSRFGMQAYPWCPDAAAICAQVAARYQHPVDELPADL